MSEELETAVEQYRQKCKEMAELQNRIFSTKQEVGNLALEAEATISRYRAEEKRLIESIRELNTSYEKLLEELTSLEAAIMGSPGTSEDDTFCGMCVMPSTTAEPKKS
jgi:vacuolar-type H+-ATPase subunit E/Vma4